MNKNEIFVHELKVEEVPWHRLTTAYGRSTDFPKYFRTMWDMENVKAVTTALNEVTSSIEHQSTLWHATPFAMIFLVRIFEHAVAQKEKNETANFIVKELLEFFEVVAQCFHEGDEMEHAEQLADFSDMLKDTYLWSEEYDEYKDEMRYEEEEVFPDDLFYSFYYYSYQTLLSCKSTLVQLEHTPLHTSVKELQDLL